MAKLHVFANSGNPDQMPHSAASDLGLHCLPITLLQVSWLQWVNVNMKTKWQLADIIITLSIGTDGPEQTVWTQIMSQYLG